MYEKVEFNHICFFLLRRVHKTLHFSILLCLSSIINFKSSIAINLFPSLQMNLVIWKKKMSLKVKQEMKMMTRWVLV